MVWIVCDDAVFNASSRRYTPHIVSSRKKSKFCEQGGKLDYNTYSDVSLLTLYHWQTLSISYLLEMVIGKDH